MVDTSTSVGRVSQVRSSANDDDNGQRARLPNPICWHEGMLLSPQHFQQNHLYWERQLRQMVSLLRPAFWGVEKIEIDRAALIEGEVSILRLLAIMPDGLLVDYDASVEPPLCLSLEIEAGDKAQTVQLAVPVQVPGSASERSEIQRYSSREDQPQVDENTGENEVIMPRLYPRLSLQVADHVGARYVGLPLFRVIKPEGGSPQLDPDYAPPLLSVGADSFRAGDDTLPGTRPLQLRAQQLALAVRHKARELAGLSEEGESLGGHVAQRHHRWIRAMVSELAAFEQLVESSRSTPADLYSGLVRMAGPISELDPSGIPPRFANYFHDDALPAFDQVMDYIRRQVDRVNLNYTSLAFEEQRDGVFSIDFDKAWKDKDLLIELRPGKQGNRDGVIHWLQACRIASITRIKELKDGRLRGAQVQRIEGDEKSGIHPASGNALFRIKANPNMIIPGVKLVIACTSSKLLEERPAAIVLHLPH